MSPLLNRREALAALASTAALPLMSGCNDKPTPPAAGAPPADAEKNALALLDSIGENYLKHFPERATSLGIDTGARAALRSQLTDRSADGQKRIADTVRQDLDRAKAFDTNGLSHATRTSVEVVRSAYATALEGHQLPYGDITVGDWRNTPYVVIQNVGAYLDIPRFIDAGINSLFGATIDATEEAVVNAMLAAQTMTGVDGLRLSGLPGDRLVAALRKYNRMK